MEHDNRDHYGPNNILKGNLINDLHNNRNHNAAYNHVIHNYIHKGNLINGLHDIGNHNPAFNHIVHNNIYGSVFINDLHDIGNNNPAYNDIIHNNNLYHINLIHINWFKHKLNLVHIYRDINVIYVQHIHFYGL